MLFHFSGNLIARVLVAALRLLGKTIITRRKSLQIFVFVFVQAEHFWLWPWCLCLRLSWKFLGNKEQTLRQSCGKSFCSRGAVQYGCGTVSCFNLWKVDFFFWIALTFNPTLSILLRQILIWNTSKNPHSDLYSCVPKHRHEITFCVWLTSWQPLFAVFRLTSYKYAVFAGTSVRNALVQPRRCPKRGSSSERCHFRELITGGLS